MITAPTVRVSYIILTITLTVILIRSSIFAVYSPSPPIALKVGFASATSSDNNNSGDESNTDATIGGDGVREI